MKRIIKYKSAWLAILLIMSAGCTKWVDEIKPETSQDINSLRTSIRDLEPLMNGAYTGPFAPPGMAVFHELIEMNGDFFTLNEAKRSVGVNSRMYEAYTHSYSGKDVAYGADANAGPPYGYDYILKYQGLGINASNTVIESIEKGMTSGDPRTAVDGNRLVGEGLAIRALSYWQMVLLIGPQYHSTTLDMPGVVYRTWPIIGPVDIPAPRISVGETYINIIRDLKRAINLLPEEYNPAIHPVSFKPRMRKDFAVATLAKVYFQMNKFDSALIYVDQLLGPVSATGSAKYPLAADIKSLFTKVSATPFIDWGWKSTDPNRIPEFIYAADGISAFRMTRQDKSPFMQESTPVGTPGVSSKEVWKIGKPYYDLMKKVDTLADQRFTKLLVRKPSGLWQNKYATSGMYFPVYRAAEFHLMRAEIFARADNANDALKDLNVVRQRAGIGNYAFTNKDALIQEIIDERGREMICEYSRFLDMKRLGALSNGVFKVPLGEKAIEDKVYVSGVDELPFDSPLLLYNLPNDEYIHNSGINGK